MLFHLSIGTVYKSSQSSNFLRVNLFATFSADSNSAFLVSTSKLFKKKYFLALFANF
jgi:hypothetical protein